MQYDYLIIGQGICGTLLSWFLQREGKRFLILDDNKENSSSKVAAGIINPVTGRRYAYTWMIDDLIPFAQQTYEEMGMFMDQSFIYPKSIIDFFPSAQMRNAFIDRHAENARFLAAFPDQNHYNPFFNYDFGCGLIHPAFMTDFPLLLQCWKEKLLEGNCLKEEKFIPDELVIEKEGIRYGSYEAKKIIFCEGNAGIHNPWFRLLPFASNKGEVLIIECADLPNEYIFKKGLMLVPLPAKDLYWVGSNYLWEFSDEEPSEQFRKGALSVLNGWLKKPFRLLEHRAAVRPATIERRPFVGLHPLYPSLGIFNGMGTKGASLAPFFANILAQHLVHDLPIMPEADVSRFSRILSR